MKTLKIGTRGSRLALWQAGEVQRLLAEIGIASVITPVKSEGDLDLVTPLYAMGVQGVFTKEIDAYLLSGKIDIAVHSMKDVPTQMALGLAAAAVLKRADVRDVFIPNSKLRHKKNISEPDKAIRETMKFHIATGSVRRKAQWLHRFPNTAFENLRGNVQTRMRKLSESEWDGVIMAKAGLERINELPENFQEIPWMLSAPAQGAILVACREDDTALRHQLSALNDELTSRAVKIERDFLKTLMGGCSTPISALAVFKENKVVFRGNILSPDGKQSLSVEKTVAQNSADTLGIDAANELLAKGADKIVELIRQQTFE